MGVTPGTAIHMDDLVEAFRRFGEQAGQLGQQFGHFGGALQAIPQPPMNAEDYIVAVADYADLMLDILVDPLSWPRPWKIMALLLPISIPVWLTMFVVTLLTAVTLTVLLDIIGRVQLRRLLVPVDQIKDIS
jgi:hypothetical protein